MYLGNSHYCILMLLYIDKLLYIFILILLHFIMIKVLLPASSILQMATVREACCKFLMRQLHPTNCLGIRSFAGIKNYTINYSVLIFNVEN